MTVKKTKMVLKVDLHCPCCYKKIQKILCKIPEITDKVFDVKANMVMITVKCCCPEKIRDKLCCKGGKIIKNIEIKPCCGTDDPTPPKPTPCPPVVPTPCPPVVPTPSPPVVPTPSPPVAPTPCPPVVPSPVHPAKPCCGPCREGHVGRSCYCGSGFPPPPKQPCYCGNCGRKDAPPPEPTPCPRVVLLPVHPAKPSCGPCREGHVCRSCYCGSGFPPPPKQPCYCSNCGPGYVYGRPFCVTTCDCFSEENSTGCTIM